MQLRPVPRGLMRASSHKYVVVLGLEGLNKGDLAEIKERVIRNWRCALW